MPAELAFTSRALVLGGDLLPPVERRQVALREGQKRYRVVVSMGTSGIAAGARETMQAIVAELQRREIDAHVTTVGCIGMCASEPLVDIEQAEVQVVEAAKQDVQVTKEWVGSMDGSVNAVGYLARGFGWFGSLFQTGTVNTYAFILSLGVLVILGAVIF